MPPFNWLVSFHYIYQFKLHDILVAFSNCSLVMFSLSWLHFLLFISFRSLSWLHFLLFISFRRTSYYLKHNTGLNPLLMSSTNSLTISVLCLLSTPSTEYLGHAFCLFVFTILFQRLFIPNYLALVTVGFMHISFLLQQDL